MDGNLHLDIQYSLDRPHKSSTQDNQALGRKHGINEPLPSAWSFGPGPRQPIPMQKTFHSYETLEGVPQSTLLPPSLGLTRLSLPPRNIYSKQEMDPMAISNTDSHFKIARNLRQGTPVHTNSSNSANTSQHPLKNAYVEKLYSLQQAVQGSPITKLADAMLRDIPFPGRNQVQYTTSEEPANLFQSIHGNRLNQLQPQKQQPTPPFNLSGFAYSPTAHETVHSSSPAAAQASSPTARVVLRRESNRTLPCNDYQEEAKDIEESSSVAQSLQQRPHYQNSRPPQALALAHAPPMVQGIQLVSPHELSDRLRQVFPYELFNAVQSKCFEPVYGTNNNVVVSAPTGSGKTAILELAICRLVEGHRSGEFKIVYQAPTKSLCSERLRDWEKKFSHLNLSCAELTGDTSQREMTKVRNASIIVTTPEKWDSITRNWSDHHRLVQMVKLFLIDEVHILKDTRGATLEAVVSRMKTIGADIRFVALSATVPNSDDVSLWLGRDHTNHQLPAHRETFGEDFRPVRLQKHVHGFDGRMHDYAFEKVLDGKLPKLIQKYTHKKPIMVFCFTRKSCESTAALLADWWQRQKAIDRAWPVATRKVPVGHEQLKALVRCGVAFHHAGLDAQDRIAIETAYLKGDISLICCTSTLAVGVNLPCHLVVLKGTVGWQDGVLVEYSDLEVMQMLGRAGRPQFDDNAVAVIMTRSETQDRYKKMISGQDVLESTLHLNLIEHLNSEISLSTIRDLQGAKRWLLGTFLSVRMRQNPNYYKLEGVPPTRDTDHRLELVCERDIKLLQEHELITTEEQFRCTEYGQAMSRYMIQFETMKLLLTIPKQARMEEILNVICQASEFKDLRMKPNERPHLREYNKSPFIKYAIKDNVSTTAHKISLIIQVQLGGIEEPQTKDFNRVRRQMNIDQSLVFDRVNRLVRCVVDCKVYDRDAIATRHALDLARSSSAGYWENSNLQLRQIAGFGPAAVRKLAASNVNSIERLFSLDTSDIERYMSKNPPFGRKLLDQLVSFPRLRLEAAIVNQILKSSMKPKVSVKATLSYDNIDVPVWKSTKPMLTFTAETSDGALVHFWRGSIAKLEKGWALKFTAELASPDTEIKCFVACEDILGTLRSKALRPDIPVSAFPSPSTNNGQPSAAKPRKYQPPDDSDEFGEDGIGDNDLLAAVVEANANNESASDDYADVDDFESNKTNHPTKKSKTTIQSQSVQMANGRWACNHPCRDGKPLKTGQHCKHRCCKEGLDKPRKVRSKKHEDERPQKVTRKKDRDSEEGTVAPSSKNKSSVKKAFASQGSNTKVKPEDSKLKLQKEKHNYSDESPVEIVDLAKDRPEALYEKLAPRDYRKLHSLHTNIQQDKPFRMPRVDPAFSYSFNKQPDLPFLRSEGEDRDPFEDGYDDNEDFPSPSRLCQTKDTLIKDPVTERTYKHQLDAMEESFYDGSLDDLEAGMIGLGDSMALAEEPPEPNSSFDNDIFDFNAFDEQNPIISKDKSIYFEGKNEDEDTSVDVALNLPHKRPRSTSPDMKESKIVRYMEKLDYQENTPITSTPSWVDEIDSDIIDGLKGFVDFVD